MKYILIIEDNQNHSFLLKSILNTKGYQTEIAQTGDEAREKIENNKQSDKRYDLLLVDIAMPGFNENYSAIEFINEYKQIYPILVVSAYAHSDEVKEVIEEKWRIKKPFDNYVLLEKVNERLGLPI